MAANFHLKSASARLWIISLAYAGMFAIVGVRLTDLQIIRGDYYQALAEEQRKRAGEIAPHRGTIYLSEGRTDERYPVASNSVAHIAYAVPRDIQDAKYVAEKLAPELFNYQQRQKERVTKIIEETGQDRDIGQKEDEENSETTEPTPEPSPEPSKEEQIKNLTEALHIKLNQKTDPYEPLLKFYEVLDEEFKNWLEAESLPGIVIAEQGSRVYPEATLAAHILGYLGWEDEKQIGQYGVEGYFNDILVGDLGWLSAERDVGGSFIGVGSRDFRAPQDGADIVLTIDRVVQALAETSVKNGVDKFEAERGTIIVMETATGAVRGMATYPTYDPNYYYGITDARIQSNPAISEQYEPGSTLKSVIMATAIEEEVVEPNTTFNDTGPVKVDKYYIDTFDHKHHGIQTMTQVLEQSNNVGMVWVGQKLGAETMYDYLRRFGFGEQTGVELEGETRTNLPEPSSWNIATIATTSFGQGIATTPMQIINATNALANQGQLMRPYLVEEIRHPSGKTEKTKPHVVRQATSPQTAEKVSAMMVSVIENGVAGSARVPGYYLAGKTGTAQVPDERGKYSEDKKIISFVGFGPVPDPKFTILIKLDNPAGLSFASGTAAPMFKDLAQKLINYYQIPPSYDVESHNKPFQVPSDPEIIGT